MTRRSRWFAALLLAFMLPVQGWAAACAQICAQAQQSRGGTAGEHAAGDHANHGASIAQDAGGVDFSHCGSSTLGAGKCCQAHTFLIDFTVLVVTGTPEHFAPAPGIARWVSFIPDSPFHPPIPASVIA